MTLVGPQIIEAEKYKVRYVHDHGNPYRETTQ